MDLLQELALFGKKKSIFSVEDINSIARLLAKALDRSAPDKIVYFELESIRGVTRGQLFHHNNRLNWRFSEVSGKDFNSSIRGAKGKGTIWKLIPQPGQKLKRTNGVFSHTLENWLVSKIKLPVTNSLRKRKEMHIPKKLLKPKFSQLPDLSPERQSRQSVIEEKLNTLNKNMDFY